MKPATNIMALIPSLSGGGAERQLVNLSNGLVSLGHAVRIITFSTPEEDRFGRELLDARVQVESIGPKSSFRPSLWRAVRRRLKVIRPDWILGWSTYANFVATLAVWGLGIKLCLSERIYLPAAGRIVQCWRDVFFWRRFLTSVGVRFLYSRASIIVTNSCMTVAYLERIVRNTVPCVFLPNTVVVPGARVTTARDVSKARSSVRILCLGRIVLHHKGFDVLLQALGRLREREDWELMILGDGPDRADLFRIARQLGIDKRVSWVGFVDAPWEYYQEADIVVVPSRFEGCSNVLLEAMVFGRAIVCTDCPSGSREATDNGACALLVGVGQAEELAAAIEELIESPELRALLGRKAKARATARHGNDGVARQFIGMLEKVEENGGARRSLHL